MDAKRHYVFFAVLVAVVSIQYVSAVPFIVKLLFEPFLLDFRIRGAAIFNDIGLGFGGFLTKLGEIIHDVLTFFGKRINQFLGRISKSFANPNLEKDSESALGKKLIEVEKAHRLDFDWLEDDEDFQNKTLYQPTFLQGNPGEDYFEEEKEVLDKTPVNKEEEEELKKVHQLQEENEEENNKKKDKKDGDGKKADEDGDENKDGKRDDEDEDENKGGKPDDKKKADEDNDKKGDKESQKDDKPKGFLGRVFG